MKKIGWMIGMTMLICGCNTAPKDPASASAAEIDRNAAQKAAAIISAEGIRNSVLFLADDALEGRGTGTEGEKKAAHWLADQFKSAGLKPLGEDFFQKVDLVGYRKTIEGASLRLKTQTGELAYQNVRDLTYWSTAQKAHIRLENAPLLFVGYGVEAPEYDWDDFKGVDCSGKILVFLNNDPQLDDPSLFGGEARTYYGRYTYKFEQAVRKGAAGAVMIHTTPSAGYGWMVVNSSGLRESFALNLPDTGYQLDVLAWIHENYANQLAATAGATLDDWFEAANRRDFTPVPLPITLDADFHVELRYTQSQNVVALWEGSDPVLKNEIIAFTAHYDHLGKMEAGEGDLIYNGAWDNGLGTASIVEIAKAFGQSGYRPKRSLVFIACAGEEKGLLGSQWFVAKPPVPLNRFVADINIDMPQPFGLTRDMVAIGHRSSSLGDTLATVAAGFTTPTADGGELPVAVKGDMNPNAGSFYRSDQVSFAKAGIPALFLLPGVDYVETPKTDPEAYRSSHYHQPGDEVNDVWDLTGCVRDMKIALLLAAEIGSAQEKPRWNAGNEFEQAWQRLHGQ